jgi:hypothetical protein
MLKRNIEPNQKFFFLTSVEFSHNTPKNCYWVFKCDCGNFTQGRVSEVINGIKKSCGCHRQWYWKNKKNTLKPSGIAARNALLNSYQYNAKKRGLEFSLTDEEFFEVTQRSCLYCGVEPRQKVSNKYGQRNGTYLYNGVDRIDNSDGYTRINSASCCGTCNVAKNNLSLEKFQEWIGRIVNHNKHRLSKRKPKEIK